MSLECKINIDLDKGIIDFSKENIDEKVNIQEYIEKIVKSVAENEELYFDEIAVSITSASKEEIKNIEGNIPDVLGDIVISIEKVKEQAKEYGHSFERELSYMVVHGFYHLMGYDHIKEEDKNIMRQKEENVLEKLKILR